MRRTEDTVNPRHPWQQPHHGGVTGSILQLKPLSVLAFRAISDRVRRQAFHREQIAYGGRFQLLSVLLCAAVRAEGAASNRSKLCVRILICGVLSDYIHHGPIDRRKEPAIDGFEPLNILAFRAILDHIQRRVFHREPVQKGNFQLLSVLLCSAIRAAHDDRLKLCCILTCGAVSDYILREAINQRKVPAIDLLRDLPEGVLCTILSKLPLDEAVRTSAVSRNWRNLWTLCPKLSFDGSMMCGKNNYPERVHVLMFIRNVNRVLAQCRGKLVQELAVKINFNWTLVEHLNNWVSFSVSSRTKALVFDLAPEGHQPTGPYDDRYKFPFELLDKDSIHRLQKIHLSYVEFHPPMQFSGFPNLRKLDLNLVNVNGEDIAHMLSNCCNLEWLSIVRCHLNGELEVKGPLPHLLYLEIASCERNTNIAFHAVNLATFEYRGMAVPIDLGNSSELECADICYFGDTLERTISVLANVLTNVQRLTLTASCKRPEIPCLMPYQCMFSRMTYLQLRLLCVKKFHSLSLVYFLRSAPFVEKLELHFFTDYVHLVQESKPISKLPECLFNNMKSMHITGFKSYNDQVEFLLHMLENAPALEVLSIDHLDKYPLEGHEKDAKSVNFVPTTARRYLEGKIPPKCTLILLEEICW